MGKVLTTVTVTNRADQILAEGGYLAADKVRSVTHNDMLADTGATLLGLPAEIVAELGLKLLREAEVTTAAGLKTMRIFQDAKLSLYGREGTFDCLELPSGTTPLLGVIPLETLGLEVNLQTQRVRVLPMGPNGTYLTVL
jgi:predicted aspartyl protease